MSIAHIATASPEGLIASALPGLRPVGLSSTLAALFTLCRVPKGATVLREGDRWTRVFLVETGSLRLHFSRHDGREFNKNFYAEGALVMPVTPEMWYSPSLFAITAMETTRLWRAELAPVRATLEGAGQWHTVQRKALARLVTHKLQREHDLLAMTGRERYAAFCEQHPALAARVPLVHLASYLGVTDVSLSRIRRTTKQGKAARG